MLEELMDVLCRPRIMKIRLTTVDDAETFVRGVAAVAQLVSVTGNLQLCRDPDDDIVLETAIVGGAAYVVSRDEDISRFIGFSISLHESAAKTTNFTDYTNFSSGEIREIRVTCGFCSRVIASIRTSHA